MSNKVENAILSLRRSSLDLILPPQGRLGADGARRFFYAPRAKAGRCKFSGRKVAPHRTAQGYRLLGVRLARPKFLPILSKDPYYVKRVIPVGCFARPAALVQTSRGFLSLSPVVPAGCVGALTCPEVKPTSGEMLLAGVNPNVNAKPLSDFRFGEKVCLVATTTSRLAWSRYSFMQILAHSSGVCFVFLPSGRLVAVGAALMAMSAEFASKFCAVSRVGSARTRCSTGSRIRLLRHRRPQVRNLAKNACDHPHGGNKIGVLRPQTPWHKSVHKSGPRSR
jgi:hypothetical protein